MNLWDAHMHTHHSGDCDALMEDMIQSAIQKGLKGICFTDHLDYDYQKEPGKFELNVSSYYNEVTQFQRAYKNRFPIHFGIEVGLQPHLVQQNNEVIKSRPFDFVIGSSHVSKGIDPYYPEFYQGRTENEAYLEYFETVLENAKTDADFDVYGHIDYVVRYGPNKDKFYSYKKYSDVIDEILCTLIQKGKGIELNTGALAKGLTHPNPTEDIIKRYKELGGEVLTLGADAHLPQNIAYGFNQAAKLLVEAGFRYFTVFTQRKPEFYPL